METNERSAFRVPPGEGRMLWVLGDLYEIKAAGEQTGDSFSLWETTALPGVPGPPPHIHHREDESFYVLEGEIELRVGDEVSTFGPGSFVHLPKGTLHTFRNAGTTPAKFLGMANPAGFEKFYEEVGVVAEDPSSPPAGPPDIEKVMATAPKYGLEIPPPSEG